MNAVENMNWKTVCKLEDITLNSGVCARFENKQIAIFRVKTNPANEETTLYAIDNLDPFSKANVLSRGITGSIGDKIVVASPIYKQHFDLQTGQCVEDEAVSIPTYEIRVLGEAVQIQA